VSAWGSAWGGSWGSTWGGDNTAVADGGLLQAAKTRNRIRAEQRQIAGQAEVAAQAAAQAIDEARIEAQLEAAQLDTAFHSPALRDTPAAVAARAIAKAQQTIAEPTVAEVVADIGDDNRRRAAILIALLMANK
jgi:hypothetical protein